MLSYPISELDKNANFQSIKIQIPERESDDKMILNECLSLKKDIKKSTGSS